MNNRSHYDGATPPCDTCASRNNCRHEMSCDNFIAWTSTGDDRIEAEKIPTRRIFIRMMKNEKGMAFA